MPISKMHSALDAHRQTCKLSPCPTAQKLRVQAQECIHVYTNKQQTKINTFQESPSQMGSWGSTYIRTYADTGWHPQQMSACRLADIHNRCQHADSGWHPQQMSAHRLWLTSTTDVSQDKLRHLHLLDFSNAKTNKLHTHTQNDHFIK